MKLHTLPPLDNLGLSNRSALSPKLDKRLSKASVEPNSQAIDNCKWDFVIPNEPKEYPCYVTILWRPHKWWHGNYYL